MMIIIAIIVSVIISIIININVVTHEAGRWPRCAQRQR
jgi:hypothetical protein